jgi:hypothetical protein
MRRLLVFAFAFAAVSFAASAHAAPAPTSAASQAGDLYTVNTIRVDATAESAQTARDAAMAQGRPQAWTRIYRRLTPQAMWARQPRLTDAQLFRLIRSFEVVGERRSTTRYLADVTFHFNPVAVRQTLRQAGIAFTETRSRPALVIPVVDDQRFDPASMWAMAWSDDIYRQGLVPMMLRGCRERGGVVASRSRAGRLGIACAHRAALWRECGGCCDRKRRCPLRALDRDFTHRTHAVLLRVRAAEFPRAL